MAAVKKPHRGQFKVGSLPNPGGRPKIPVEITTRAREVTPQILERLIAMATGKLKVDHGIQLRAAAMILDRAWGTPRQSVEVTGEVAHYVMRLPEVAASAEEWEESAEMQAWRELEDQRPN